MLQCRQRAEHWYVKDKKRTSQWGITGKWQWIELQWEEHNISTSSCSVDDSQKEQFLQTWEETRKSRTLRNQDTCAQMQRNLECISNRPVYKSIMELDIQNQVFQDNRRYSKPQTSYWGKRNKDMHKYHVRTNTSTKASDDKLDCFRQDSLSNENEKHHCPKQRLISSREWRYCA